MDDDRLELDLRYAAGRNQLAPRFRPVVDVRADSVAGFVVEAAWAHPALGTLGPDRFVPLAERIGLAADLDRWILDRACAEVAAWGAEALDALALLVVPCTAATAALPSLPDDARAAADLSGLPPDRLALLVPADAATSRLFSSVRRAGLRLATTTEVPHGDALPGPLTVVAPPSSDDDDARVIAHVPSVLDAALPPAVGWALDPDTDALGADAARELLTSGPAVRPG